MLKSLLVGRPDGLRQRLVAKFRGTPAPRAGQVNRPDTPPAPPVVAAERSLALKFEPPRDVTPPEGYEVVLHKDSLEAGKIIEIIIGGTAIAIANVDGSYYATSNACPHAEGPLGEGQLDGCIVTCPYHGWKFDVRDGSCSTNPYAKVATYPVQVVKNAVCVRL